MKEDLNMAVAILTTGGTIAKIYENGDMIDCANENVSNTIGNLRLEGTEVLINDILHKDSLDFDDNDRQIMYTAIQAQLANDKIDAILVTHGTDTMVVTIKNYIKLFSHTVAKPVIFTGAMRPLEVQNSDGVQNITEALLACRLVAAGIYISFHGRVLSWPGIIKDYERGTFKKAISD